MPEEIEKKSLQYYLDLKYPVTIEPAPEGGYFVQIEELPGCYSQGETIEEAMDMIEEARRLWTEVALEENIEIPLPRGEQEYSGKFFIRTPKSLHRKLDREAKREGVSLNQYLVSTLSRAVGHTEISNEKSIVKKHLVTNVKETRSDYRTGRRPKYAEPKLFVVNEKGEKTEVILDVKQYQEMMEDLEDALALDKAIHKQQGFRDYRDVRKELVKEGRL